MYLSYRKLQLQTDRGMSSPPTSLLVECPASGWFVLTPPDSPPISFFLLPLPVSPSVHPSSSAQGKMSCLMINDIDAGIGRFCESLVLLALCTHTACSSPGLTPPAAHPALHRLLPTARCAGQEVEMQHAPPRIPSPHSSSFSSPSHSFARLPLCFPQPTHRRR